SVVHLAGDSWTIARGERGPAHDTKDADQLVARRALQLLEKALVVQERICLLASVQSTQPGVEECLWERFESKALEAESKKELMGLPRRTFRRESAHSCEDAARENHRGVTQDIFDESCLEAGPPREVRRHYVLLRREQPVRADDVVRTGQAVGTGPTEGAEQRGHAVASLGQIVGVEEEKQIARGRLHGRVAGSAGTAVLGRQEAEAVISPFGGHPVERS